MKVLKFFGTWCAPCSMLTKMIEGINNLKIAVEEIDIDVDKQRAIDYSIRGVPTCILLDDQNNEMARRVGMMTETQFKEFVGEL